MKTTPASTASLRPNSLHPGWTRRRRLAVGGLLVVFGVAAYWNSLDAPFVFDDRPAVVDNPTIRHVLDSWRTPANGSSAVGRPVVNVSWALNYAAGGLSVRGYHATNLALHLLTALTLWGILRRTLQRHLPGQHEWLAFGTTLLWSVHPLLTESVTCIAQRSEVLAGLFYLLAIYGFIRSVEPGAKPKAWPTLAVGAGLLGILTKETVATVPLVIFLYDRAFVAGTFRAAWTQRKGFHLALAAMWLPLAALVAMGGERTGTVGFGLGVSAWDYLLTQCRAIALYLKLALWPHPLIIDYGVPVIRDWAEVAGRGLLIIGLLGATIWALVKRPALGFVGAVFFIILAPSSSVLPLTTQTIAEHRMYLPLVPLVLAATMGLRRALPRRFPVILAIFALALAVGTIVRNDVYRDEFRLWRQTMADAPDNPRAYSNLGNAYVRAARWSEAVEQLEEAVRRQPDFADAQNNLGLARLELGDIAGLLNLENAARLKSEDADIRLNLANAYQRANRPAEAEAQAARALTLRPKFPAAQHARGTALLQLHEPRHAAEAFAAAVGDQPDYFEALAGWGNALWDLGDGPGAIQRYEAALRRAPESAELHYNLANVLLALDRLGHAETEFRAALTRQPDFPAASHNLGLTLLRLGRAAEAVASFEAAARSLPHSAMAHANLSRALAQAGRMSDAVAEVDEALRLDPQDGETQVLARQLKAGKRE